ncbi:MAG: SDR family oxidoreductase [Rhodospirillaceae bacterium]|jgi:NAD(P)-dependent dehydrogenase (short-subunit alcohol dehydrogenase family)|nr:SDR family oxidoreductase [Rhodospirillaceae bacterium]MBT4042865.1 SDR family oxidoreductase [Rhodospirillaceae bacterium]MBT4690186.1 SDR family oxidoreductase [Rhodospirillaceae bacterium]MBT5080751.1 SDR family oxidoreductase [Rhodospirillaceae bacterium]MBT5525173.1 SDR family oxidoreductase [Rhodospirillaceae bacterium]
MQSFDGKLAVITGGGSGIGRALAEQLAGDGCHLALCDLSPDGLAETSDLCQAINPNLKISTHICDVSDEAAVLAVRDEVMEAHDTDQVNLVFANAGIGGGGSFIVDERADWERTFNVCWHGVYYTGRAFMPLLIASDDGHLINTSSINGVWASLGPNVAQTAYAAAKFAVKGFSEALVTDLRLHAPHVKVSVVMPGHIGTNIGINSRKVQGKPAAMEMTAGDVASLRDQLVKRGRPVDNLPDDALRTAIQQQGENFRDKAPTSPREAAAIILDGVQADRWRILVGDDAYALDEKVRANPEDAYEPSFTEELYADGHFHFTKER